MGQEQSLAKHDEIDEAEFSRLIALMGKKALLRMKKAQILICGLKGLGLEVAKNVILAGVKKVVLHDTASLSIADLSSHFFASEADVGKNRAEVSRAPLAELNGSVEVVAHSAALTETFLADFTVVVLTDSPLAELLTVSDYTHANDKCVIVASTRGLFAQIFCDFGNEFTVVDTNGQPPVTCFIGDVTKEEEARVFCDQDVSHGFSDGDHVIFKDILGMTQLNNGQPKLIKEVLNPREFIIDVDTRTFDEYVHGGTATSVKTPMNMKFASFRDSLLDPNREFVMSDWTKMTHAPQLHIAFQALDEFVRSKNAFPRSWNAEDAKTFVDICEDVATQNMFDDELDRDLLEKFSFLARGDINPMAAAMGGIVAQEVMKACSGKFTPIQQWFYFDALECLPDEPLTEAATQPQNCRYDGQIAIFGDEFQKHLSESRIFVVGSGAIGCELLKNFALIGVGTGADGKISVTDNDSIELSNLNRQFLFHRDHVGKSKSVTAAAAVQAMNPDLVGHIEHYEDRVGEETEDIFDDKFYTSLDCIVNALDNNEARAYMDQQCIYYRKPLLDSGTEGARGHTLVVLPHRTESFSSSVQPPAKAFASCTLRFYPNRIEHTLQWARNTFNDLFVTGPTLAATYLEGPEPFKRLMSGAGAQPAIILESVKSALVEGRPQDFADCVSWARIFWERRFNNEIRQLLHNFPADHKTTSGAPFWSGTKRCPSPLEFSLEDDLHVEFVLAAANLRAFVYNIEDTTADKEEVKKLIAEVEVPAFEPKDGVEIAETDEQMNAQASVSLSNEQQMEKLRGEIPAAAELRKEVQITPVDFEKDDDSNFHMAFITAASNSRAAVYTIPPASFLESKLIAGNIIAAISTTTSMVAGFAALEFYKITQGHEQLELYKNAYYDLAVCTFTFEELKVPPKIWKDYTLWDFFDIKQEMTLRQFLAYFEDEHDLDVDFITYGATTIDSFIVPVAQRKLRLDMTMPQLVEHRTHASIPAHAKSLIFIISCTEVKDRDVEEPAAINVPNVRYFLMDRQDDGDSDAETDAEGDD